MQDMPIVEREEAPPPTEEESTEMSGAVEEQPRNTE